MILIMFNLDWDCPPAPILESVVCTRLDIDIRDEITIGNIIVNPMRIIRIDTSRPFPEFSREGCRECELPVEKLAKTVCRVSRQIGNAGSRQ